MNVILRSIFHMPGVILHEFSHHLFCILFNAKVTDVCYYNFKNSSGYVHYLRPKHLYQDVLISTAPFFLNSLFSGLIAYPTVMNKLSITGFGGLNWQDFLRILISISIGTNAIPSKGDGLNIWTSLRESDINFLLKFMFRLILAPLVLLIYFLNFASSYLNINFLYGACTTLVGPKLIQNLISADIFKKLINF